MLKKIGTCFDPSHRAADSNPDIRLNDVETV